VSLCVCACVPAAERSARGAWVAACLIGSAPWVCRPASPALRLGRSVAYTLGTSSAPVVTNGDIIKTLLTSPLQLPMTLLR
jgi:hypothetical protein